MRTGSVPLLNVNRQRRFFHDSRVAVLEPVIPPAEGLISPFDLRAGFCVVGEGVIPGTDDRLHRRLDLLKHTRDGIAIAVEQASDQEARNFDFAEWPDGSVPELAVALMLEIHQRPGRGFETRAEGFFVERV